MELSLRSVEQAEKIAQGYEPHRGEFGQFILALPDRGMSAREARKRAQACARMEPWPVLVGIPPNHDRIAELSAELVALEQVKERHELGGDPVARREVFARLAATRSDLEDQLQAAVSLSKWHDGSEEVIEPGAKLSPVALYESILAPSAAISHAYETWTAVTTDGRSFSGLLISKTDDGLVIRGADGVDVSLETADIEELVRQPISLMPADLATVLSEQELVDLVAWLGTLKPR
jgi:putative heme-binding domain-containing protein